MTDQRQPSMIGTPKDSSDVLERVSDERSRARPELALHLCEFASGDAVRPSAGTRLVSADISGPSSRKVSGSHSSWRTRRPWTNRSSSRWRTTTSPGTAGSNRIYPSPDGVSIFFHEITQRKHAEQAARDNAALLRGHNQVLEIIARGEPLRAHARCAAAADRSAVSGHTVFNSAARFRRYSYSPRGGA